MLGRAPTHVLELKAPPLDLADSLKACFTLDVSNASRAASTWLARRAGVQRDMLLMVLWHRARGKSLQTAEQEVLEALGRAVTNSRLPQETAVSHTEVWRLQAGVVRDGVAAAPGVNIVSIFHALDRALIPANPFTLTAEWDSYTWGPPHAGSAYEMLRKLVELSYHDI